MTYLDYLILSAEVPGMKKKPLIFKLSKMDYYVYKADLLYTEQCQNKMKSDKNQLLIIYSVTIMLLYMSE